MNLILKCLTAGLSTAVFLFLFFYLLLSVKLSILDYIIFAVLLTFLILALTETFIIALCTFKRG